MVTNQDRNHIVWWNLQTLVNFGILEQILPPSKPIFQLLCHLGREGGGFNNLRPPFTIKNAPAPSSSAAFQRGPFRNRADQRVKFRLIDWLLAKALADKRPDSFINPSGVECLCVCVLTFILPPPRDRGQPSLRPFVACAVKYQQNCPPESITSLHNIV